MGHEMPQTFPFIGAAIKFLVEDVRETTGWLETNGYKI
jgi:hypothetical protein